MKKILKAAVLFFSVFFSGALVFAQADDFSGIDMVSFQAENSKTGLIEYNIGENSGYAKTKRYLKPFYMNRYETTYKLWYTVRKWATANGYTFKNPGQEGSEGIRGRAPSSYFSNQPVTAVSWYDAIVWCNALSEMKGRKPCYTYDGDVLRDSSDTALCDMAECDWQADGYRLPSEAEWEYAARKTKGGLQRGDLVSGQVNELGQSDSSIPQGEVAWYCDNCEGSRIVGIAGTPFDTENAPMPGSGNPNGAGLFDMSGNVLEWCWDWYGDYKDVKKNTLYYGPLFASERVMRGGSYSPYTLFIFAGDRYSFDPNEFYEYQGFRFASSAE